MKMFNIIVIIMLCKLITPMLTRSIPVRDKTKQVSSVTIQKELTEIKWVSDENAVLQAWDC